MPRAFADRTPAQILHKYNDFINLENSSSARHVYEAEVLPASASYSASQHSSECARLFWSSISAKNAFSSKKVEFYNGIRQQKLLNKSDTFFLIMDRDGKLCSACHNSWDAQGDYGVPTAKNTASPKLKPSDILSNRSWVGPGGWAERFVKNPTKPTHGKAVVQAWIDNDYE
jgi:hypothetical protein